MQGTFARRGGGSSAKMWSSMLEKSLVWNGGSNMEKLCLFEFSFSSMLLRFLAEMPPGLLLYLNVSQLYKFIRYRTFGVTDLVQV